MTARIVRRLVSSLFALALMSGAAFAQSKVTIAIGGASCLCYLPTVLAQQLGEYERAGVKVEMVDFKGGSQALTAVQVVEAVCVAHSVLSATAKSRACAKSAFFVRPVISPTWSMRERSRSTPTTVMPLCTPPPVSRTDALLMIPLLV